MKINIGDEITINGKVVECDVRCSMVCCRMNDGTDIWIHSSNINTIHPYKEPSKEDMRKGN